MVELQIKTESLPTRCEICHKSDCYNAQRDFCSRCANFGSAEMFRAVGVGFRISGPVLRNFGWQDSLSVQLLRVRSLLATGLTASIATLIYFIKNPSELTPASSGGEDFVPWGCCC